MVGYGNNGYRLWNPNTKEIIKSRDVRFDESQIKYNERKQSKYKSTEYMREEVIKHKQKYDDNKEVDIEKEQAITVEGKDRTGQKNRTKKKQNIKTTRYGRVIKQPNYKED